MQDHFRLFFLSGLYMWILWVMVGMVVVGLVMGYVINKYFLAPRDRRKFELFVSNEWRKKGYKVETTRSSKDGGYDCLAIGNGKKYYISCKRYKGSCGVKEVREIFGVAVSHRGTAVIATTGRLTREAYNFCKKNNILINQY